MIPVSRPTFSDLETTYVTRAMKSGLLSWHGEYVERFERALANYCDVAHARVCSSGTAALHLALLALDLGPNDDVYIPACSYIATANAVTYTGARPVFCDVDETWCIDPAEVKRALVDTLVAGRRPRAVIAVHLYGVMADMPALRRAVQPFNVAIIEDAAEAIGAQLLGRPAGCWGDLAAFSFFGNKIVSTGEGGAVLTAEQDLADRVFLYRGQGQDPGQRFRHSVVGYNYRMTNLQAAVGLAQMANVNREIENRLQVARWYREFLPNLDVQPDRPDNGRVWWLVSFEVEDRDAVAAKLAEQGIETRPVFPALTDQPPYRRWTPPNTARLARRGLSLPTFGTMTRDDVQRVAEALSSAMQ